jgi:DNA-3-methyladenine glycosylase
MGRADALKPSRHKGGHPPLPRAELPVDTVSLARYLIGKMLVREMAEGVASGRIVETEAYVVGDAAGHAYRGMTPRNRSLFLERGHAYVYLVYGSAYMLNVSSEIAGIGAGVLIRALEPRDGIPIMQRNRQIERLRDLTRGPGRLAAALRVDRRLGLAVPYTDLRKFLDTSVPSTSSHGSPAGTIYRAGKAGAQAMAQSERIKASSAANRFQAVSHASMMSPRLGNTELASQWLRR